MTKDEGQRLFEANQEAEEKIRQEQEAARPNVSAKVGLDELLAEFAGHEAYTTKVRQLLELYGPSKGGDVHRTDQKEKDGDVKAQQHGAVNDSGESVGVRKVEMRRIRGDGCCFYRAVVFGLLEWLAENPEDITRIRGNLNRAKDKAVEVGYSEMIVDDFFSEFDEALDKLSATTTHRKADFIENLFNDEEEGSDKYLVMLARLLTSTHLKANAHTYQPFLTSHASIGEYCKEEVDPMWKEAEQLHIIALTSIVQIAVRIVYLDSSHPADDVPRVFVLPEIGDSNSRDAAPVIMSLLYRPGHYDIIYLPLPSTVR